MIKAFTTILSILLVLGAASRSLVAQPSPAQTAADEAVRRQANIIKLHRVIEEAQKNEAQGELVAASRLYEEAWELVESISVGIDKERMDAASGLGAVRLELAKAAQQKGDFIEADKQVSRILRVDSKNLAAINFKKANDKALSERKGRIPSREVQDLIPESNAKRIATSTLVQDGRLLVEMGKLDDAEVKLRQAVKQDPENKAAFYYLSFIDEARHAQEARRREIMSKDKLLEVEKSWNLAIQRDKLPANNPFARTNLINTSPARQQIYQKLDKIVLAEIFYDGIPLGEVVKDLSEQARKISPPGLNFIVNSQIDIPPAPIQLGGIDPVTGQPLPAAPPPEPVDLNNAIIRINPPLRNIRLADVIDAITKVADKRIKFSVEDYAIVFSQRGNQSPQMFTRTFRVNANTFIQGLESVSAQFLGTGAAGGGAAGGAGGGIGGGGAAGGLGGGGVGGGGGSFAFPRVDITGASALGGLGGGGLGGGIGGGIGGGAGGIGGGAGGIGGGAGGIGGGVGGSVGIGITGITQRTDMSQVQSLVRLFFITCGINFPPPPIGLGIGGVGGGGLGGGAGGFGGGAGGFGGAGGQQIDPTTGLPVTGSQMALFYNDRTGIIFARASMEDLDIMEQAIQALNVDPPQVTIEARFTEVSQNDNKALGFDWFLGNSLFGGGRLGLQGGSASSYAGNSTPANPTGTFPGIPGNPADPNNPTGTLIPSQLSDQQLSSGLANVYGRDRLRIPTVGTITGILTDPQFRVVIRALEQRDGVDVLSAPSVTTLSGRQAKIDLSDLRTIVTGQGFGATPTGGGAGGVGGVGGLGAGAGGAVAAASNFGTTQVPLGPQLDVLPTVSADGYSVQMTLIPTLVEFLGYDDPGPFLPQAQSAAGNTLGAPLTAVLPLPRFRLRQVITSANVWDGQTIVLGGLIAEDVAKIKDKVPVLGDIPFLGRLFRSESMTTSKKNLVIFVTPILIDPAGNRIHSDDNLPYDPNLTPTAARSTPAQQ